MKHTILLIAIAAACFGRSANVVFLEKTVVAGPSLVLADIARVTADDPGVLDALSALKVGTAPLPGLIRRMRADRITAASLAPLRAEGLEVRTGGAEVVTVVTACRSIMSVMIEEEARRQIFRNMPWPKQNVQLVFNSLPERIQIPDLDFSLILEPAKDCDWKGEEAFHLAVLSGGRELKRIPVNVRMKVFQSVCIADKKIPRNTPITEEDVRFEEREITALSDNLFFNMDQVAGKRSSRTISGGTVITDRMVEIPPVVRKGEKVTIISRQNSTVVSVSGIANRDGRVGEKIRVRNLMDQRLIWAWVCGEGTVSLNKEEQGESL